MSVDSWLDRKIRPPKSAGRSVLVLCRTSATANTVRAWAARRRGVPGLEIATPRSLASQFDGPWLAEPPTTDASLPATAFAERIRVRPGLVALARAHVADYRLARAATPDVRAPAWLVELADSPWHTDTALALRLLELARRNGPHLTASHTWDRVVPLGFGGELDPWTTAVMSALVRGFRPQPFTEIAQSRRAILVTDTAAEARLAATMVSAAPTDSLILVQHDATAARIHRALLRNGVPSAWRATARLERHTLASVIRRCVPWFSGASDPTLRAVDLHFVLRHPMLGQRLPPPADVWLREHLAETGSEHPERTQLSGRALAAAIRRARHLDAPLSRWISELRALLARTDEPGTPGGAARLLARLLVLQASVTGASFCETFDVQAPEEQNDWGDFDALVANLLGEFDPHALPPISECGTLGALRRFLLSCRVRSGDDPASLRILGALRRGADRPATRLEVLQLLRGTVDRGEVTPGVEILTYEDYDARPVTTLVLCDVHDQGLAARPRPDPLLSDAQLEALGALSGRARVALRLQQLERAAAQADRVITLVTERDAMGRAVVAPVQLSLTLEPIATGAYGLGVQDLPESVAITALQAVPVAQEPPTAPDTGDRRLDHYIVQATAEWCRHGRGPIGAPAKVQHTHGRATLAHLLVRRPSPPIWVQPWLGNAHGVPEAALPEQEFSVSRFFRPVSHCLYQAFGRTVLRIQEPETVAEELDAREVGNAVHDALEAVALRGAWRHTGEPAATRESFKEALSGATESAFEVARGKFGALSPARRAATEGLEARWRAHWDRYVQSRVQPGRERMTSPRDADPLIFAHRYLDAASSTLQEMARQAEKDPLSEFRSKIWVKEVARIAARGGDPKQMSDRDLLDPDGRGGLPAPWISVARDFLDHPYFHDLVDLWRRAEWLSLAVQAPTLATVAELPFGERGEPVPGGTAHHSTAMSIGPISLTLGEQQVDVQGFIDRLSVVGWEGATWLRVVDYKTGKGAPSEKEGRKLLYDLVEPQLVIYGLVVLEARAKNLLPDPFAEAELATIGWDHLRATDPDRKLEPARDRYLIDDATLRVLARALGSLVGKARAGEWWLSPRKDTCPQLSSWRHDYCPLAGACRLRALDVEGP